jgi:pyridoxamine 5'-phosphate oxidase
MAKLSDIRKSYTKYALTLESADLNPFVQFNKWFNEAVDQQVDEPNAMTLSTVNETGRPTSRIVLLKGVDQDKFIFYTNYQSGKGKELEANPACALNFFWPSVERQIRIEGVAERVAEKISEEYFQSRPRGSQIGAWASPQSSVIKNRELLEQRATNIDKKFEASAVLPRPKQWGGYAVNAFKIEFWQGRENRLHDRLLYAKTNKNWEIVRLAP